MVYGTLPLGLCVLLGCWLPHTGHSHTVCGASIDRMVCISAVLLVLGTPFVGLHLGCLISIGHSICWFASRLSYWYWAVHLLVCIPAVLLGIGHSICWFASRLSYWYWALHLLGCVVCISAVLWYWGTPFVGLCSLHLGCLAGIGALHLWCCVVC